MRRATEPHEKILYPIFRIALGQEPAALEELLCGHAAHPLAENRNEPLHHFGLGMGAVGQGMGVSGAGVRSHGVQSHFLCIGESTVGI